MQISKKNNIARFSNRLKLVPARHLVACRSATNGGACQSKNAR